MKKISVIIPMYNSENFIQQSIQSVLNQTYPWFEILVVDDESTDRGAEICEGIAAADNRVNIFRKKKAGVSAARNSGLDMAKGDYVFFLDSDDLIHPQLFEEMIGQMETYQAEVAFCFYEKGKSAQIDEFFGRISCKDRKPEWKVEEHAEAEVRFHMNDAGIVTRIGGKMMRMDLVKNLRFDDMLINGEDTLFLYQLLCRLTRSVFTYAQWYYYRQHAENASRSSAIIRGERYFEYVKKIRDSEYEKGHYQFAQNWEVRIVYKMEKSYLEAKRVRDMESCRRLQKAAKIEKRHPLYRHLSWQNKLSFSSCFSCLFLFHVQRRVLYICRFLKRKVRKHKVRETGLW